MINLNESTNKIWAMIEDGKIGLRFDFGDNGRLLLSKFQARVVIETLECMLRSME